MCWENYRTIAIVVIVIAVIGITIGGSSGDSEGRQPAHLSGPRPLLLPSSNFLP